MVEETIRQLDTNYQQEDAYCSILLRLEYLNRTIINNGKLPDSIVAGIGLAITCLKREKQQLLSYESRAEKVLTGRLGRPSFQVSEDQLSHLVESGFSVPQISLLLWVSIRSIFFRHFD